MTAQITEQLIYKGEELSLCEEPLRVYLHRYAKDIKFESMSTALWRGYVGTWSIEEGRLYLIKLKGYRSTLAGLTGVGLTDVFPGFHDGVFAHWYSGELRCPMGGLLNYVHGGYASQYEMDLYLRFEKGVFKEESIIRNGYADPEAPKGYHITAMTTFGGK